MTKEEVVRNNPLRILGLGDDNGNQKLGLVMARAGLGKTAVLVQVALDYMFRDEKVLHVSIGETVEKAKSWYEDIYALITSDLSEDEAAELKPSVMSRRLIMTFNESSFNVVTLDERLDALIKEQLYTPDCLIIDGYDFNENDRAVMEGFLALQKKFGFSTIWFSAISHRDDSRVSGSGVPAPCHEIDDMFGTVLFINPNEKTIELDIVKCAANEREANSKLVFDPSTMLVAKI